MQELTFLKLWRTAESGWHFAFMCALILCSVQILKQNRLIPNMAHIENPLEYLEYFNAGTNLLMYELFFLQIFIHCASFHFESYFLRVLIA